MGSTRTLSVPLAATLGLVLLAAHFLRQGQAGLCGACLLLAGLAWTRRGYARFVLAAALAAGAVDFGLTAAHLVAERAASGQPWLRLVAILAGSLGLVLFAAAHLVARAGQRRFDQEPEKAGPKAAAALLTAGLLFATRRLVPLPILLADRFLPHSGPLEIAVLSLYAAWACGALADPALVRRLRPTLWGLFSFVFFLQLGLGLCGFERLLMTGVLHLPVPALIVAGPLYRGGGLFMLILFLSTVLLAGPAWCSHLCYIGAWDSAFAAHRPPENPEALRRFVVRGRLATLGLTAGGALVLRLFGVGTAIAVWLAAGFGLAGVGVMAALSRRSGQMVHCAAYCPIGLVANVLGRIAPWRLRIGEGCKRCKACQQVCRYAALTDADFERGSPGLSCTLCGDCLSACAHDALGFAFPGLSLSAARAAFAALIASLHAVFLAVARI